jgi:hypothetical protein
VQAWPASWRVSAAVRPEMPAPTTAMRGADAAAALGAVATAAAPFLRRSVTFGSDSLEAK